MGNQAGFLTPDEFVAMVRTEGARAVANAQVLAGAPFVFRDAPGLYPALQADLAGSLGLAAPAIVMVGSGRTGFSLSPDNFGKAFSEDSDIDITVISAVLFDQLWFDLIRLPKRKAASLHPQTQEYLTEHRKTRIFHGRAMPHQLVGATTLTGKWFAAFKSVGRRVPDLAGYELHGMLFRTLEHARLYYTNGLSQIKGRQEDGAA